jgi:hypothetical protein
MACAAAENFVDEIYGNDVKLNDPNFQKLLEKFAVTKERIASYARQKLPSVNGVGDAYLLAVCDLDVDRYYTDPCPTAFGCVVLFLEQRKEERDLTLDEARSIVADDIMAERRRANFIDGVRQLHAEISSALAAGDDVSAILRARGIPNDSYAEITLANAAAKGVRVPYVHALNALGRSEFLGVFSFDERRNEVLLLAVTKRDVPAPDSFSLESRRSVAAKFMERSRASLLEDFFCGSATPVRRELEKLWIKKP